MTAAGSRDESTGKGRQGCYLSLLVVTHQRYHVHILLMTDVYTGRHSRQ
eukprot:COSAG06_NODE_5559_length_3403_cov_2.258777_4_plen_49_part_00